METIVRRAFRLAAIHEENVTFYHFKTVLAEKNIWLSWPWRWIPTIPRPDNPKEFLFKLGSYAWQATPIVLNVVSMYLQHKQAERAHKNAQQQHKDNCNLHKETQEKQQNNHIAQMAQALKFHMESQNKQQLFHDKNMEQANAQKELQERSYKLSKEGQNMSNSHAIVAVSTTIGTGVGVGVVVWKSMACGAVAGGPIGAGVGAVVGLLVAWAWGK